MLNIIYGRSGSGKTSCIFERLAGNFAAGKKSFLLVPDQFSMFCERKLIEKLGVRAQAHIEVFSFSRFANRVLNDVGPLRVNYADNATKNMLIEKVLTECSKNLTVFRRKAAQSGFSPVMSGIISEFKRYGVTPEIISSAAGRAQTPELKEKLNDIAVIYNGYSDLLSAGYTDIEDNLSIAVQRVRLCSFLDNTQIYIDNFKSFSAVEFDIITQMLLRADVTISLCCDDLYADGEISVFASAVSTFNKLSCVCSEYNIPVGRALFLENNHKHTTAPDIEHIERCFFDYTAPARKEKTKNVTVYYPKNYYHEVNEVCALITDLTGSHGYKFSDICVLVRNFDNYDGIIPALFSKHRINYFLDQKRDIMFNPLIRHICSAAEILAYGFSYERVMGIAKSGFCDVDGLCVDLFENYILAADVSYRLWRKDEGYRPISFIPEEYMEQINTARKSIVSPVMRLSKAISGRKTVGQICEALNAYLMDIDVIKSIEKKLKVFAELNEHHKIDEYTQAWNTINSLLTELSEVMGNDFITYEKFYGIFISGFADVKISAVPPSMNEILISSVDLFRNHDAKVVIVLGVNDGEFPKAYKYEGLISDLERNELKELGIELADTQEFRQIEEQNLIYKALTAPSEKLFIFTPLSEKDGKPLNKSYINIRLRRIFENLTEVYPDNEQSVEFFNAVYTEQNEKLSPHTAKKLYGDPVWLSISRVEKYNSCAFSFFLQYGLMLKPRAGADFKINDRGSILHAVLSEYFSRLKDLDADYAFISRQVCFADVKRLYEETVQTQHGILYELSPNFKYFSRRICGVAQTTAWSIVKFYKRSEFRPLGFEIKFRPDGAGDFPSKAIEVEAGRGMLVGDIDRVDTANIDGASYVSIIDYKSSDKKLDRELVERGVQIQPLVYCGMMCDCLDNAKPAAMLYMRMDEPFVEKNDENTAEELLDNEVTKELKMTGWVLDDEKIGRALDTAVTDKGKSDFIPTSAAAKLKNIDMREKIDKANEAINRAAQNMLIGDITVNKSKIKGYDQCKWCEYASICGKNL